MISTRRLYENGRDIQFGLSKDLPAEGRPGDVFYAMDTGAWSMWGENDWEDFTMPIGGGGGSSVTVEALAVTANGDYTAPQGKAYSPVSVDVANTYTAGDEGKVVSSGALAAQTSRSVSANGTYDTTENNEVVVNVPTGGGNPTAEENDVNFIDYDGTIRYSYTAAEFAELTSLPPNPTHAGLVAEGWNWTLADAKEYVANFGVHDIGQTYTTDDGAVRFTIDLASENMLSLIFNIFPNGTFTIDWGDRSLPDTVSGTSTSSLKTVRHTYQQVGKYVISVNGIGRFSTYNSGRPIIQNPASSSSENNYAFKNAVIAVRLSGLYYISGGDFGEATGLEDITISKDCEFASGTGQSTGPVLTKSRVEAIILPPGVGAGEYIPSSSFSGNKRLLRVSLPKSFNRFSASVFSYCESLRRLCVTNESIGMYGYTCYECKNLAYIAGATFGWDYSFVNCYALIKIKTDLGENVYNSSKIQETFRDCRSLPHLTITSRCTNISSSGLANLVSLKWLRFNKDDTPPTISATSDYSGMPTSCIIYVPFAIIAAYITATNYPDPATYTYIGFATYTSGDSLPTKDSTEAYNVVWYATQEDAKNETNAITEGNGNEIYCRYTAVQ